eukprot:scaffold268126_cov30-Tisochrysis_lutea.AAC.1
MDWVEDADGNRACETPQTQAPNATAPNATIIAETPFCAAPVQAHGQCEEQRHSLKTKVTCGRALHLWAWNPTHRQAPPRTSAEVDSPRPRCKQLSPQAHDAPTRRSPLQSSPRWCWHQEADFHPFLLRTGK